MMRVGTQRRSKSSNNSPNTTYRQSPTSNTRTSPINASNSYSATKSSSYAYRPSPSPVLGETQKYAQDYHKLSVENRMSPRAISPSLAPRSPSPTFADRKSPNFPRTQSPDYITSKRLNDRRYLSASPNPAKKDEYDSGYTNRMQSMHISDSKSPSFTERSTPSPYGYTSTSRYEKHAAETRTYNSGYDPDSIDTSPIVKVSPAADKATSRRDSWDAIAKTRNMLSHRSLESVANLTESQLNSELQRQRAEEHLEFVNREQSYRTQNYAQSYSQKYSNSNDSYMNDERTYGSTQPYKNGIKAGGASAVKVQPVPDGVLGQPVEFESK